jgi:hypothetical protein
VRHHVQVKNVWEYKKDALDDNNIKKKKQEKTDTRFINSIRSNKIG